jgi:hypothetical protein
MEDVAVALQTYAGWLYVLVGVLMLRQAYNLWRAGRDRATALFELEREAATGKATRALVMSLLLATIVIGIYTVANVIVPALPPEARRPDSHAPIIQAPPTAADWATDTPTPPPASPTRSLPLIVTATPGA